MKACSYLIIAELAPLEPLSYQQLGQPQEATDLSFLPTFS